MIQLKACEKNLINNNSGVMHWTGVKDAFFNTPGQWDFRKDESTGHCWLDPRPDDESIDLIYQAYYTHSDGPAADHSHSDLTIWNQALAYVQFRKMGYEAPTQTPWLAKLISIMPTVTDAAEMELLKIPADKKGRLLDVGCGSGAFLKKMRARGWSVAGVEPDKKAAARLAESDGIVVYGSVNDVVLGESMPFDVVVLSHVIEHLPDPVATLRELRALMVFDSKLIITTPNIAGLGARVFGRFWRGLEPPRHFNVFTPDSIKLAFRYAGYEVEQCSTSVRGARSLWYLSYLARNGHMNLEIHRDRNRMLKFAGYFFQLIEGLLVKAFPDLGEELYCLGVINARKGEDHGNRQG